METKEKMWMDAAKNMNKDSWNSYAEEFADWRLNNQLRDRRLVAEHLLRSQSTRQKRGVLVLRIGGYLIMCVFMFVSL